MHVFPVFKSAIAHKNFLEVCYVFLNTLVAIIRKENYASSFALKSENKASFANRPVNLYKSLVVNGIVPNARGTGIHVFATHFADNHVGLYVHILYIFLRQDLSDDMTCQTASQT